ncbi:hypothetical protein HMI56_005796 [Coelomomyces lativittatus]|nr:hypothetical protein HMI56_005796 [Coelomomyces lativittatus]
MHSEALWCLAGSQSGSISLFSVRHDEGTRVTTLDSHTSVVSCLVLDKEEQTCFSGSWDSKIMHWDLNTGTPIRVYSEHPSQVSCIRLHPKDPNLFSSCSISGSCFQWDIRAPEPITRFPLNSPPWSKVVGKFSIRLVPNQTPEEISALTKQYIDQVFTELKSKNTCHVHVLSGGKPWVADPKHWNFQAAQAAVEQVFGIAPDFIREGGSIPVTLTFQEALGKNVLLMPMGRADDGAHSVNEKLDRFNYLNGIKLMASYLNQVSIIPK